MDGDTIYLSNQERLRVKELIPLRERRRFIVVREILAWRASAINPDRTEYATEDEARVGMKRKAEENQ